ncbi:MAG: TraB/GumN family protein [Alphaproteobacteria bacterium]|nr:TraB/GumN family protein [Alphaproteobacteria bacterium]
MKAFAAVLLSLLAGIALPATAKTRHLPHTQAVKPAIWTVHGPKGTAFLFGSVHVLPPRVNWKTPVVLAAIRRSDTFVFEIPLDHQEQDRAEAQRVQKEIMDLHGMLPPGESLRGALSGPILPKYDLALAELNVSPGYVDRLQPWLASMVLETAQFFRSDARALNGVDVQVYAMANAMHRKTQGFETLEQQLALIGPEEQKAGMFELDRTLDEALSGNQARKFDALVVAWEHGDVGAIEREADTDFARDPSLKKSLLDDRNARWASELKPMLEQPHTYFVTVGAAHLAGPQGLPALLRNQGYRVDGP